MKDLVKFIKESNTQKYLICKAIICDDKLSDYLLESYPTDKLSNNLMNQIKKYIQTTSRSVDVFALTFTNNQHMQYKDLSQGLILNINDKTFICMGSGDGIDEEEFCNFTGKDLSVFKKGYYISKGTVNNEYKEELNIKDIKPITLNMVDIKSYYNEAVNEK